MDYSRPSNAGRQRIRGVSLRGARSLADSTIYQKGKEILNFRRILAGFFALQLSLLLAQPPSPRLTPAAQKIKEEVLRVGVGGAITVITWDGSRRYGTVLSIEAAAFSIQAADSTTETIPYSAVRKVRKGRRIRHRHWKKFAIVMAVAIGLFTLLLISESRS